MEMAEATLNEKLSRRHIDLRLDDVPPGVVEAAKLHILDSLGCLLAGSCLEPGKLAYSLAMTIAQVLLHLYLEPHRGFYF